MQPSLSQLIDIHAKTNPHKIALVCNDLEVTYGELYKKVLHLTSHFQKLQLFQQRMALMLPNSIDLVVCYLACFRLGITVALINYSHNAADIKKILTQTEAKGLVIHQDRLSEFENIELSSTFLEHVFVSDHRETPYPLLKKLIETPLLTRTPHITSSNDATIFYTSGSTGQPKGVVHTHASVYAMLENVNEALQAIDSDVMLIPLPLWHIGGFTHALSKLMIGATVILLEKNEVNDDLLSALEKYQPNLFIMHVPNFHDLLYHSKFTPILLSSMKACVGGGDKIPLDLQKQIHDTTGIYLQECYGMTEANLLTINRSAHFEHCGSIGKPLPGVQIKLMKNATTEALPGEIGEIYCRGNNQFDRYWHNLNETHQRKVAGWFKTGDLARWDSEGYLWFLGRVSQLIHRGQMVISPLEVEELLLQHSAVKAAGVIGVTDPTWGEAIKACVVLKKGSHISPTELKAYIFSLNPNIVPDYLLFVDTLPRTKTGKIDRIALKEYDGTYLSK